ncbi:MAG: DUF1566 domain-containing protein [Desulfobacterales bacterium]|nr:DUF1566 domain-containing protein [Desulfobacterales bacterium]
MRTMNCIVLCILFSFVTVCGVGLYGPGTMTASAGSLDSPAARTSADSAMYTIEDIYNRLNDGTAGSKRTGAFTEPDSGPTEGTGHTLDQVMEKAPCVDDTNGAGVADVASGKKFWGLTSVAWGLKTGTSAGGGGSAAVAKTGQTPIVPLDPAPTGSDGDLQKGVAWPDLRFTDNTDGTVTDNLTGLIWLKKADYNSTAGDTGTATWDNARLFCNALESGQCGLTDGSSLGDWRLPNVKELSSLIDWAYYNPALSNADGTAKWTSGDAFAGVQSRYYWSSTTYANSTVLAWHVYLFNGYVRNVHKDYDYYVWPVRGGQ